MELLRLIKKKKKAQIWSIDVIIGIIIFVSAVLLFFHFSIRSVEKQSNNIENIMLDAKVTSNQLVSIGYPSNWTKDNVIIIGLTDGKYNLSENKISEFKTFSSTKNYSH